MSTILKGNDCTVEICGRSGIVYSEGGRSMRIDAEMLTGDTDLVVYTTSVGLWADGSRAGGAERERVLVNLRAALAEAGLTVEYE
jgi:hypothetical protein